MSTDIRIIHQGRHVRIVCDPVYPKSIFNICNINSNAPIEWPLLRYDNDMLDKDGFTQVYAVTEGNIVIGTSNYTQYKSIISIK